MRKDCANSHHNHDLSGSVPPTDVVQPGSLSHVAAQGTCSCDRTRHTSCSYEKRKNIHEWKELYFPSSNTSCGTIAFESDTRQSLAECVHLYASEMGDGEGGFDDNKLHAVYELMTEKWNIPVPNHIVSVVGDADQVDTDEDVLNEFKNTIRNISKTSGVWVITGGIQEGVTKDISEALKDEIQKICVGIPSFGNVADKDSLKELSQAETAFKDMISYDTSSWVKTDGAYLDSCHSHFILYDDSQEEEYIGEICFRAALENHMARASGKPYILLVFGGEMAVFKAVCETINYGHKVVLVKGSGGVADCMIENLEYGNRSAIPDLTNADDYKELLSICRKKKHLFIVAGNEGENSINKAVNGALLSSYNAEDASYAEALRLALLWQDTSTLMRMIPINERQRSLQCTKNPSEDLENLLVLALARGNVAFVKMLLYDYEISIREVVTFEVLQLLYGYQSHESNFSKEFLNIRGKKEKKNISAENSDYEDLDKLDAKSKVFQKLAEYVYHFNANHAVGDGDLLLNRNGIIKVRRKFCDTIQDDIEQSVKSHTHWELFIWAVVCNLPDIAKVLWPLGEDQIGKALTASNYFGRLAKDFEKFSITDHKTNSFSKNKNEFSKMACHLLNECYKKDESSAMKLIRRKLKLSSGRGKPCLELAVVHKNHDFISQASVQKVLTDVWAGKLDVRQVTTVWGYMRVLLVIFLPFLIPIIRFDKREVERDENLGQMCVPKCVSTWIYKLKHFYSAPAVVFVLDVIFYAAFIMLYSLLLLDEGRQLDTVPSYADDVLYVMVFGTLTTELFQISQYDQSTISRKMKAWIADFYSQNFWDFLNLALFIIAFLMSITLEMTHVCQVVTNTSAAANTTINGTVKLKISRSTNATDGGNTTQLIDFCACPHFLHSINCMLWTLRGIAIFRVHSKFGKYLEMVKLMLIDLLGFFIAMIFLVFAYGVFHMSVLFPHGETESLTRPLLQIVFKPWFYLYGEYFTYDTGDGESTLSAFKEGHTKTYEEYTIWIVLGIYLCLTNIVLVNIIIAAFNNAWRKVMEEGTKIWCFTRYQLVVEYMNRCIFPSPICIIQHLYFLFKWIVQGCPVSNSKTTSDKMNYRASVDVTKLCKAETILLSKFQCDRALHIFKKEMKIIDGHILMKESERKSHFTEISKSTQKSQQNNNMKHSKVEVVIETMKKLMIKFDEQSQEIKVLSEQMKVQAHQIEKKLLEKNEQMYERLRDQSEQLKKVSARTEVLEQSAGVEEKDEEKKEGIRKTIVSEDCLQSNAHPKPTKDETLLQGFKKLFKKTDE